MRRDCKVRRGIKNCAISCVELGWTTKEIVNGARECEKLGNGRTGTMKHGKQCKDTQKSV